MLVACKARPTRPWPMACMPMALQVRIPCLPPSPACWMGCVRILLLQRTLTSQAPTRSARPPAASVPATPHAPAMRLAWEEGPGPTPLAPSRCRPPAAPPAWLDAREDRACVMGAAAVRSADARCFCCLHAVRTRTRSTPLSPRVALARLGICCVHARLGICCVHARPGLCCVHMLCLRPRWEGAWCLCL